jgi:hypothetical protein
MKKIIILLLSVICTTYSCSNSNSKNADPKQQEKDLLQEVLKSHEKVMTDDDKALHIKRHLDTLYKQAPLKPIDKKIVKTLIDTINKADGAMESWMTKFNADNSGKTHEQVMQYLTAQHAQVANVDTQLNRATLRSTNFIKSLSLK